MEITISLSPEEEVLLSERASASGEDVPGYVHRLIGRHVRSAGTLAAILEPVRREFADSGMSEDDLDSLVEEAREEICAGSTPPPAFVMSPRAVFDCMELVQAVASERGPAFACFQLAREGKIELYVSPAILAEIAEVLGRPSSQEAPFLDARASSGVPGRRPGLRHPHPRGCRPIPISPRSERRALSSTWP